MFDIVGDAGSWWWRAPDWPDDIRVGPFSTYAEAYHHAVEAFGRKTKEDMR